MLMLTQVQDSVKDPHHIHHGRRWRGRLLGGDIETLCVVPKQGVEQLVGLILHLLLACKGLLPLNPGKGIGASLQGEIIVL